MSSSTVMPKENTVPDELRGLVEKRSIKDRRRKTPGRLSDDDDAQSAALRKPQRDRRQQKNFRDLLDDEE